MPRLRHGKNVRHGGRLSWKRKIEELRGGYRASAFTMTAMCSLPQFALPQFPMKEKKKKQSMPTSLPSSR